MKEFILRRNHFDVKSVIRNSYRQVVSRFTKEFTQIRNLSAAQFVIRLSENQQHEILMAHEKIHTDEKKRFGYSK